LDLTITTNNNELNFGIYRKPMATDLILHNSSCHPNEHKKSAINYLYNRINTYKLTKENKNKEEEAIAHILENNGYSPQIKNKRASKNNIAQKDKWITFMHAGPRVRTITKLFQNTNMKVAFRMNNTIKQHINAKEETTDKYNLCGAYQMGCKDCNLKYVGQTGCTFRTRYKEHTRELKTNGQKSKYAQHILDTIHNYDTVEKTMQILQIEKKGRMLNVLESYHIYELTKQKLQMNEALTDNYNLIYIMIKEKKPNTWNPTPFQNRLPTHI
jgi:hypothetical protein